MEKKNMVLLTVIAVATLLVAVVGATFAFFTANVQQNRTEAGGQGETNVTTAKVASTTTVANVSGEAGKFTATEVYPGHKEVAALQIGATSDDTTVASSSRFQIIYDVTENTLKDNVTVTLYRTTTQQNIGENNNFFNCQPSTTKVEESNETRFTETCDATPAGFGTAVATKTLKAAGGAEQIVLSNEKIDLAVGEASKTYYYYVVVEFVNKDASQNDVMGTTLNGTINVLPA